MATYPREITIEAFGTRLLTSGDLDPLYIALYGAKLTPNQIKRFLFAYWCCYHAGASCYLSEFTGAGYWTVLGSMAANVLAAPTGGRWPRGHERRHFRGDKAINAVDAYVARFETPEDLFDWIITPKYNTHSGRIHFFDLRKRIMELPQFGPWIAFKVGDMLERICGLPINFDDSDVFLFDSPREAALETAKLWSENLGGIEGKSELRLIKEVTDTLIASFKDHLAPPRFERVVNVQEVETILCKWKSHMSGFYPLGLDTREIREGLHLWAAHSTAAQALLGALPLDEAA